MASAASSSVGSFYSIQASRLQRRSKDKPNRSSAVTDNVLQPRQLYDNQRNHTRVNRGSNFDKDGYTPGVVLAAEDYRADSESEEDSASDSFDFGDVNVPAVPLHERGCPTYKQLGCLASDMCHDSNPDIVSLLQQQQAVLQKVLDGQKSLHERQDLIEEKFITLKSQCLEKPSLSTPTSSSSDGKRKRVVTRTLFVSLFLPAHVWYTLFQNKVYSIHKELENQFKESERLDVPYVL